MHPTDADAHNRSKFAEPAVVASYAALTGLSPCERVLLEQYVSPGGDVLDLGVGAGRTTPFLSSRSDGYVGLDYSTSMLGAARRLHRDVDLVAADTAGLLPFVTRSFDVVVFSYNGIDYLHPNDARNRCLSEVHRVLRPGGVLVFSTHNPRSLVALPKGERPLHRLGVAAYTTARRVARLVPTAAFLRGDGYVVDSAQGGLVTHFSTPRQTIRETTAAGFRHLETLGSDHPRRSGTLWTPWWYYVFTRL